jgi:hypothetical protein
VKRPTPFRASALPDDAQARLGDGLSLSTGR